VRTRVVLQEPTFGGVACGANIRHDGPCEGGNCTTTATTTTTTSLNVTPGLSTAQSTTSTVANTKPTTATTMTAMATRKSKTTKAIAAQSTSAILSSASASHGSQFSETSNSVLQTPNDQQTTTKTTTTTMDSFTTIDNTIDNLVDDSTIDNFPLPALIGIIVGGVLCLIIVIGLLLWKFTRKNTNSNGMFVFIVESFLQSIINHFQKQKTIIFENQ
jgi:cobalamin biosynthesis Mg chelatase CobN